MKIRKAKIKQLLKLNLLKSKVYEQPVKKIKLVNLIDSNLNKITVNLKKVLQIIYQYHQIDKRILFVGLPHKLELKINQFTKHVAVPKTFDIQRTISCNWEAFESIKNLNQILSKNSAKFLLPKLAKKLDLIVLFDYDKSKTISSEVKGAKIPLILFGNCLEDSNSVLYKIEGNFKNILNASNKNIFFVGLNFLFRKPKNKTFVNL